MASLLATLGLNGESFRHGLHKAKEEARHAGEEITRSLNPNLGGLLGQIGQIGAGGGIGAAIGAAAAYAGMVVEVVEHTGEMAHAIELGSERLGVSAERFQDLEAAAKKSGSGIEAIYTAYRKLAASAVEAENGNDELIAAFQTLGLTLEEVKGKSPDELFKSIAEGSKGAEMDVHRLAALMKTMGKSADELIPGLKAGKFSKSNPFALSEEQVKAGVEYEQNKNFAIGAAKHIGREAVMQFGGGNLVEGIMYGLGALTRKMYGVKKEPEEAAPVDLKTVSKAELASQRKEDRKAEAEEKRRQERIERLKEQLYLEEQRTQLEGLQTDKQILELKHRRAKILAALPDMSEEGRLQARIDIEKLDQETQRLEKKEDKPHKLDKPKYDVNELQKIGAFAAAPGAHEAEMRDLAKHTHRTLQQVEQHLAHLVHDTRKPGRGAY